MAMMSPPHTDPKLQSLEPTLLIWRNNGRSKSFKTDTNRQPVCNFQASIVSLLITGGGRFPQIVPFQGLKIGVSSGCLGKPRFLSRDITIANLSVRYVPVSDENALTYCITFFHRTVAQSF